MTSLSLVRRSSIIDPRILLLATGMFAIGTDSFVIAGLLDQIGATFGLGTAAAGQLVTAYGLCYAILTPVAAVALSNWRRERVLLTGLVIFLIGNLLAAFGGGFGLVLAGRGISGVGAAIFAPMASATAVTLASTNQRAVALSIMMTALGAATAFGSPLGILLGGLYGWRTTFLLVGLVSLPAIFWLSGATGLPPANTVRSFRERLAPVSDLRVVTTLLSTFLVLTGLYITYTYIGVVLDSATFGSGTRLAILLCIWGITGTLGTIISGRLTDRFGNRLVINSTLVILVIVFLTLPWTGATFIGASVAIGLWGICAWAFVVPQQHRLTGLAPRLAPVLLGLYATSVYAGTAAAGAAGGLALVAIEPHKLPLVSACLILLGLAVAEWSSRLMAK